MFRQLSGILFKGKIFSAIDNQIENEYKAISDSIKSNEKLSDKEKADKIKSQQFTYSFYKSIVQAIHARTIADDCQVIME